MKPSDTVCVIYMEWTWMFRKCQLVYIYIYVAPMPFPGRCVHVMNTACECKSDTCMCIVELMVASFCKVVTTLD